MTADQTAIVHAALSLMIGPSFAEPIVGTFASAFTDAPGGFSLLAPIPVLVKEEGLHFLIGYMDGVEVARAPFTLREQKSEDASQA